jgi:hypothetical protein
MALASSCSGLKPPIPKSFEKREYEQFYYRDKDKKS